MCLSLLYQNLEQRVLSPLAPRDLWAIGSLLHFQLVLWKNSMGRLTKKVLRFPMCEGKSGLLGKVLEGGSQGNLTYVFQC